MRRPGLKVQQYLLAGVFLISNILPPSFVLAQTTAPALVSLSEAYSSANVNGLSIYPNDPFKFDFIVTPGDSGLSGDAFRQESAKLIKYFLAALTVPEKEMWVNLSPYEKDRIIPDGLAGTQMGMDMLAQDHLLKQITASLIYPDSDSGKKFWAHVYEKAYQELGTTDIPLDTLNKVWIAPDKAVVYERNNHVFVVERHLKVMLESDYLALDQASHQNAVETTASQKLSEKILKEIIIPEIEKEVNTGKNFAALRQIYNALILAAWYKKKLRHSVLGQVYVDANKIDGININDASQKERLYESYLETFRKGVFNFIREEYDSSMSQIVPRKYFSGGLATGDASERNLVVLEGDFSQLPPESQQRIVSENVRKVTWSAEERIPLILVGLKKPLNRVYEEKRKASLKIKSPFLKTRIQELQNGQEVYDYLIKENILEEVSSQDVRLKSEKASVWKKPLSMVGKDSQQRLWSIFQESVSPIIIRLEEFADKEMHVFLTEESIPKVRGASIDLPHVITTEDDVLQAIIIMDLLRQYGAGEIRLLLSGPKFLSSEIEKGSAASYLLTVLSFFADELIAVREDGTTKAIQNIESFPVITKKKRPFHVGKMIYLDARAMPSVQAAAEIAQGASVDSIKFQNRSGGLRYLEIPAGLKDQNVVLYHSMESSEKIVQLLMSLVALRLKGNVGSVSYINPYPAYARQDRISRPGESVVAATIANVIDRLVDYHFAINVHYGKKTGWVAISRESLKRASPNNGEIIFNWLMENKYFDEESGTEGHPKFISESMRTELKHKLEAMNAPYDDYLKIISLLEITTMFNLNGFVPAVEYMADQVMQRLVRNISGELNPYKVFTENELRKWRLEIESEFREHPLLIVAPDKGSKLYVQEAKDALMRLMERNYGVQVPVYSAYLEKKRDPLTGAITRGGQPVLLDMETDKMVTHLDKVPVSTASAFIVDDMTDTGGTLLTANYILVKELGLEWRRVYMGVVHGVLSDGLIPFRTGLTEEQIGHADETTMPADEFIREKNTVPVQKFLNNIGVESGKQILQKLLNQSVLIKQPNPAYVKLASPETLNEAVIREIVNDEALFVEVWKLLLEAKNTGGRLPPILLTVLDTLMTPDETLNSFKHVSTSRLIAYIIRRIIGENLDVIDNGNSELRKALDSIGKKGVVEPPSTVVGDDLVADQERIVHYLNMLISVQKKDYFVRLPTYKEPAGLNDIEEYRKERRAVIARLAALSKSLEIEFSYLDQNKAGKPIEYFVKIVNGSPSIFKRKDFAQKETFDQSQINFNKRGDIAKGGIDFDPSQMSLEVEKEGDGVQGYAQTVLQTKISGLTPVIIGISPVNIMDLVK